MNIEPPDKPIWCPDNEYNISSSDDDENPGLIVQPMGTSFNPVFIPMRNRTHTGQHISPTQDPTISPTQDPTISPIIVLPPEMQGNPPDLNAKEYSHNVKGDGPGSDIIKGTMASSTPQHIELEAELLSVLSNSSASTTEKVLKSVHKYHKVCAKLPPCCPQHDICLPILSAFTGNRRF